MRSLRSMRESLSCVFSILCIVAVIEPNAFAFRAVPGVYGSSLVGQMQQSKAMLSAVPSNGLIDYIGRTVPTDNTVPRWSTDEMIFSAPTDKMIFSTRVNLFRQLPWKKIRGKVILKAKISGTLPLEGASSGGPFGFGGSPDLEPVESLQDFQNLLSYATVDPRVEAIVLEIGMELQFVYLRYCRHHISFPDHVTDIFFRTVGSLNCGYAKLQEARRMMAFYRQSGKKIIGYCSGGAEKELYFSLGNFPQM